MERKEKEMKYVRTKDGIIDIRYWLTDKNGYYRYLEDDFLDYIERVDNEYIIKQADTIEELCDEYVVVSDSFEKLLAHTIGDNDTKEVIEMAKIVNGIIYGAIWTDKGLIYVAKMNEKGELELL